MNFAPGWWFSLIPVFLAVGTKYVFTVGSRHVYSLDLFGVVVACLGTRIFALSVLLVANGCSKAPNQAEDIRPVLTQRIALGADAAQASYAGEVKARYEVPLSFRIAGKVISRHAEVGSSVKKGQLLARLDPADLQINVANAKAQVAAARADFEQARSDLARDRDLV